MHPAAYNFVAEAAERYRLRHLPTLEIGSRFINGTIREVFPDSYGIDILPGGYVDEVADGSTFVPKQPPSVVVCCEVFEHTEKAEAICKNVFRMLPPGGFFIVTAAGVNRPPHSGFNGGALREGEFYRNVSAVELMAWLSDFHLLELNVLGDDIRAVARKDPDDRSA